MKKYNQKQRNRKGKKHKKFEDKILTAKRKKKKTTKTGQSIYPLFLLLITIQYNRPLLFFCNLYS